MIMNERELAQLTITFLKMMNNKMNQNMQSALDQYNYFIPKFMLMLSLLLFVTAAVIMLIFRIVYCQIEHHQYMKVSAAELIKLEREKDYWDTIGRYVDPQLHDLLTLSKVSKDKRESNPTELTRAHFDPRYYKGGIHKDDYE